MYWKIVMPTLFSTYFLKTLFFEQKNKTQQKKNREENYNLHSLAKLYLPFPLQLGIPLSNHNFSQFLYVLAKSILVSLRLSSEWQAISCYASLRTRMACHSLLTLNLLGFAMPELKELQKLWFLWDPTLERAGKSILPKSVVIIMPSLLEVRRHQLNIFFHSVSYCALWLGRNSNLA